MSPSSFFVLFFDESSKSGSSCDNSFKSGSSCDNSSKSGSSPKIGKVLQIYTFTMLVSFNNQSFKFWMFWKSLISRFVFRYSGRDTRRFRRLIQNPFDSTYRKVITIIRSRRCKRSLFLLGIGKRFSWIWLCSVNSITNFCFAACTCTYLKKDYFSRLVLARLNLWFLNYHLLFYLLLLQYSFLKIKDRKHY